MLLLVDFDVFKAVNDPDAKLYKHRAPANGAPALKGALGNAPLV